MSGGGGHGGGKRRKHHEEHEEHENHERWLVSYADLVTVLMALFIVMFAMSNVDSKKFLQLKASLASSFGNPIVPIPGGPQPAPDTAPAEGPLDLGAPMISGAVKPDLSRESIKTRADREKADGQRRAVEGEIDRLEQARRKLIKTLEKKGLQDQVKFRYDERGLVVSIVTDKVLFAADRAELSPVGETVLRAIGPVLKAVPNGITVEGHTNTVPVKPKYFPSEWELSTARAVTVVRHLVDRDGVPARRLGAIGYADQRPLVPGTSERANRLNRRVEIILLSTLPPEEKALLPRMAPDESALAADAHASAPEQKEKPTAEDDHGAPAEEEDAPAEDAHQAPEEHH